MPRGFVLVRRNTTTDHVVCSLTKCCCARETECGLDCHKKCEKFIPNLCGVNQKILAEVLGDLKLSNKVGRRRL